METLVDTQKFQSYLDQIQNYTIQILNKNGSLSELVNYIEEESQKWPDIPSCAEFFKAEQAFFNQDYDTALKYYLQARMIPHFQFFCYRASAFISKSINNQEKAVSFSRKALKLIPHDYLLLQLLKELLPEDAHSMQEIETKLKALDSGEQTQEWHPDEEIFDECFEKETISNLCPLSLDSGQTPQPKLVKDYLKKMSGQIQDHSLLFLAHMPTDEFSILLSPHSSSGIYLKWNGKGIVLNPNINFLSHFHENGLHIRDIDYVIAPSDHVGTHCAIQSIHQLVNQVNRSSSDAKIISYFLNQKTYRELSHSLKPHFKQEKNSVHCLELFLDSPDVEKVELNRDITLHYFSQGEETLGFCLELKAQGKTISLAHLTGLVSPAQVSILKNCDALITDENCLKSNDFTTLIKEIAPSMVFCTEFSFDEGDRRLELISKLRHDSKNLKIFPADEGLFVDLLMGQIQCSLTKKWVSPSNIQVIKTKELYGKLHFLSPSCYL